MGLVTSLEAKSVLRDALACVSVGVIVAASGCAAGSERAAAEDLVVSRESVCGISWSSLEESVGSVPKGPNTPERSPYVQVDVGSTHECGAAGVESAWIVRAVPSGMIVFLTLDSSKVSDLLSRITSSHNDPDWTFVFHPGGGTSGVPYSSSVTELVSKGEAIGVLMEWTILGTENFEDPRLSVVYEKASRSNILGLPENKNDGQRLVLRAVLPQ